ncbi:MAG TPA: hypothetical protein VF294_00850, partial [Polyangiaceae bacterium]
VILFGRDLLVEPKFVAGRVGYDVSLPHADWYDALTGALITGGGHVQVPQQTTVFGSSPARARSSHRNPSYRAAAALAHE